MHNPRKRLIGALMAGALVVTTLTLVQGPASAQQAPPAAPKAPPAAASGEQAKPAIEAGSKDKVSAAMAPLGATKSVNVNSLTGQPISAPVRTTTAVTPAFGAVSGVDFSTFYNYCQGSLVYTTVANTTAVTQYVQVQFYANGGYRTFYTSVAAGGTAYPAWYGVTGTYYAYLYVWNGSSYVYDEYKTAANNCNVSVTFTAYPGYTGYVLYTIKNNGTAYASVETNELAPYPVTPPAGINAIYVGRHFDYPAAGGGTIYRYVYVGTGLRFGVYNNLYGANGYSPWYWYGSL